jgi:hypothetical protein
MDVRNGDLSHLLKKVEFIFCEYLVFSVVVNTT